MTGIDLLMRVSLGSPLATPWWAEANIAVGFVVVFCVSLIFFSAGGVAYVSTGLVAPIIYYTNTWYSAYLPYVLNLSSWCLQP